MNSFYSLKEIENFCHQSPTGQYSLVIDTMILAPFLIGLYDKNYLAQCSLTAGKYTSEDFELTTKILKYFRPEIIVTPNIITELYNLTDNKIVGQKFSDYFLSVIRHLRNYQEHYTELKKICGVDFNFKLLTKFGFADMSIIEAAKEMKAVILTDERPLYDMFFKSIPIIKFSHIKTESLQALLP